MPSILSCEGETRIFEEKQGGDFHGATMIPLDNLGGHSVRVDYFTVAYLGPIFEGDVQKIQVDKNRVIWGGWASEEHMRGEDSIMD